MANSTCSIPNLNTTQFQFPQIVASISCKINQVKLSNSVFANQGLTLIPLILATIGFADMKSAYT